ncbi:MAG: methyltransferase domain-containing protein [Bacteroidia bacterium]|nr:MAG: methyltransferase domain-containing protein [Bacteroidia bacterium]
MRIISGIFRGKRIHPPGNFKARPTTDFAKENLFNILIHKYDIEEMDVLDLFSGTGSIAYEFASRVARSVVAVEMAPLHFRFIQETCRTMQIEQIIVIRAEVFKYLKKPIQSFDIIFADPPFDHPGLADLPDLVLTTNILNNKGLFILEHPGNYSFTAHPRFLEHRQYGGVNFTFFS